jgi:hypothetical protein
MSWARYDRPVQDEPEDVDLDDRPDALAAYRCAYDLALRSVRDRAMIRHGDHDPERELATLRARLPLRGLDPTAEARIRAALDWGEADGRADVEPRW